MDSKFETQTPARCTVTAVTTAPSSSRGGVVTTPTPILPPRNVFEILNLVRVRCTVTAVTSAPSSSFEAGSALAVSPGVSVDFGSATSASFVLSPTNAGCYRLTYTLSGERAGREIQRGEERENRGRAGRE
jgi:hypothetical protein